MVGWLLACLLGMEGEWVGEGEEEEEEEEEEEMIWNNFINFIKIREGGQSLRVSVGVS